MDDIQIDLATAIVRMEQAYAEIGTPLGDLLLMRLATCDAPRLRRYLTPVGVAVVAREEAVGVELLLDALRKAVEEAT